MQSVWDIASVTACVIAPAHPFCMCFVYRRPLFKSSGLLSHKVGRGAAAFDWRAKLPSTSEGSNVGEAGDSAESSGDPELCRQSLFIEPVQWMGEEILVIEGKVSYTQASVS